MATLVADLSKDVLETLSLWRVPVDPFTIASEEGIELAPGSYGEGFDARIEFLPVVQRFAIYYQLAGPGRPDGRVRFSIAHELGHFYLPDHRDRLLRGEAHNSQADFRSRQPQEVEADEFAASLLMPRELFVAEVHRFRQRVCTLAEICRMADERFHTSVTSTARRYCQCDIEACSIVISRGGAVQWSMHSEDMKAQNMRYIPCGGKVPPLSKTSQLWESMTTNDAAKSVEGAVEVDVWFERPFYRKRLWEEAMVLGNTGFVLSYLTLEVQG